MKDIVNLDKKWLAKRNDLAKRIVYLFVSVRILQKNQFKESELLIDDEVGKVALHLAEVVYPNPLKIKLPLKKL